MLSKPRSEVLIFSTAAGKCYCHQKILQLPTPTPASQLPWPESGPFPPLPNPEFIALSTEAPTGARAVVDMMLIYPPDPGVPQCLHAPQAPQGTPQCHECLSSAPFSEHL